MIFRPSHAKRIRGFYRRLLAYTLPEMLMSMAIFSVAILGVSVSHVFGIRLVELSKAKLGASDEARRAIDHLVEDVREGSWVDVGNGSLTNFVPAGLNSLHQGTAIQIYPNYNITNIYVRYYWDTMDRKLKRTTNGSLATAIVVTAISNQVVFSLQDHLGNVLMNNRANSVMAMTLEFYQLVDPTIKIGPGGLFDYYRLQTKTACRAHQ